MPWEELNDPLASTCKEAIQFIDTELACAVPEGWRVHHSESDIFVWCIVLTASEAGGLIEHDYRVELSRGLDCVIFTYGNSDAGPWPSLHQCLQTSLRIRGGALRHLGMAACLQHLMRLPPNVYGFS